MVSETEANATTGLLITHILTFMSAIFLSLLTGTMANGKVYTSSENGAVWSA